MYFYMNKYVIISSERSFHGLIPPSLPNMNQQVRVGAPLTVSLLRLSARQTRQTLRPDQSDLTGAPAAQNAVYAVRGEQGRGFTALPLAAVVDIFLKLATHVVGAWVRVSGTPVGLQLSPGVSAALPLLCACASSGGRRGVFTGTVLSSVRVPLFPLSLLCHALARNDGQRLERRALLSSLPGTSPLRALSRRACLLLLLRV